MEKAHKPMTTFNVVTDLQGNVIAQHEGKAIEAGIHEHVRNYLLERILSHRIDGGKSQDMTQLLRFQGRIAEIEDLLGLFKV